MARGPASAHDSRRCWALRPRAAQGPGPRAARRRAAGGGPRGGAGPGVAGAPLASADSARLCRENCGAETAPSAGPRELGRAGEEPCQRCPRALDQAPASCPGAGSRAEAWVPARKPEVTCRSGRELDPTAAEARGREVPSWEAWSQCLVARARPQDPERVSVAPTGSGKPPGADPTSDLPALSSFWDPSWALQPRSGSGEARGGVFGGNPVSSARLHDAAKTPGQEGRAGNAGIHSFPSTPSSTGGSPGSRFPIFCPPPPVQIGELAGTHHPSIKEHTYPGGAIPVQANPCVTTVGQPTALWVLAVQAWQGQGGLQKVLGD